jgi:hypothetical protein
MNDAPHTSNLPESPRTFARASVASIVLKGQTKMTVANTRIFLSANNSETGRTAFSNLGSALEYVRDSHADLCAAGAALMLDTPAGLVPATNKAVKAARGPVLTFLSTDSDSADKISAIQSRLDGALQACALVGIDPSNVATVADLRESLAAQQLETSSAPTEPIEFSIEVLPLHKRKHNKRS